MILLTCFVLAKSNSDIINYFRCGLSALGGFDVFCMILVNFC